VEHRIAEAEDDPLDRLSNLFATDAILASQFFDLRKSVSPGYRPIQKLMLAVLGDGINTFSARAVITHMRSAAAGVCVPRLANGFLTRPQPARFRSTGYAMGSKSGNRIYAPGSRAFLKQWKHSRIDRRISCRQDFPSISSSATALSDSLRRGSFCSGRIVRQTRVEFRPSNPEGSRGFESAPLRQPVTAKRNPLYSVLWLGEVSEGRQPVFATDR